MIVTVTPNPALDITYRVDGLSLGETLRVAAPAARAGGKGVNVARVALQAGYVAHAVLTAGGARGAEIGRELGSSGIPCTLVPVSAETRSTITLVDAAADSATVLAETGGPMTPGERELLHEEVRRKLGDATCLVVSGSLPPDAGSDLPARLVADARAAGVPVIVDAVGEALRRACDAGADVVKPNRRELAEATGTTNEVTGALALIERGARLVVVSLGPDGMLAVSRHSRIHASLPEMLHGNATGAGDAAVAAIATALVDGADELSELLRRATAWSAAAVLSPLAGELAADTEALAARVAMRAS